MQNNEELIARTTEYVSIKRVHAIASPRIDPSDQTEEPGYVVVYNKGTPEQYVSWCPKKQFEEGNLDLHGLLPFGVAHSLCKAGKRIARINWNGKGMWLIYIRPCEYDIAGGKLDVPGDNPSTLEQLPWIAMKTADNKIVPWLASQTDLDAEDWVVID